MTTSLLNGKKVAQEYEQLLTEKVQQHSVKYGFKPGLAVICVGEDPASKIYVNHKRKACERVGIISFSYDLTEQTTEADLLKLIHDLNHNTAVHGILVQLPLPQHINTQKVIEAIDPTKDVDGFHPYNLGRLAQGTPLLRPCTPYGIIKLLDYYKLSIEGQHAVVIGTSNIVGRPMGLELLLRKATVTLCHSKTKRLENHVRNADILIVAAGVPNLIAPSWLHKKQVVIDVGIHRDSNGIVHGDLDFNNVRENVAFITPVPGGVGPMTIYTLLENTFTAAYR